MARPKAPPHPLITICSNRERVCAKCVNKKKDGIVGQTRSQAPCARCGKPCGDGAIVAPEPGLIGKALKPMSVAAPPTPKPVATPTMLRGGEKKLKPPGQKEPEWAPPPDLPLRGVKREPAPASAEPPPHDFDNSAVLIHMNELPPEVADITIYEPFDDDKEVEVKKQGKRGATRQRVVDAWRNSHAAGENLTLQQLADRLGISAGLVSTTLSAARKSGFIGPNEGFFGSAWSGKPKEDPKPPEPESPVVEELPAPYHLLKGDDPVEAALLAEIEKYEKKVAKLKWVLERHREG